MFVFRQYGDTLQDREIFLTIQETLSADDEKGYVPEYSFLIMRSTDGMQVGAIRLRIGDNESLRRFAGHIGYGIDQRFRGHRYAAKACCLLRRVAADHDLRTLWLTCRPENKPSRRTCELIGADFIEVVNVPKSHEMYQRGSTKLCRYRWQIEGVDAICKSLYSTVS